MSDEHEIRERIARLEERFTFVASELRDQHSKINEMHAVLLQAKGAKWALLAMASLGGGIAALLVNATKFLPFVNGLPK